MRKQKNCKKNPHMYTQNMYDKQQTASFNRIQLQVTTNSAIRMRGCQLNDFIPVATCVTLQQQKKNVLDCSQTHSAHTRSNCFLNSMKDCTQTIIFT